MSNFKARFIRKLYSIIPLHMKRLVLWCSVVSAYRHCNEVDGAHLKALNDLLELARWQGALGMPIQVSKVIWEDFDGAVKVLHDAENITNNKEQQEKIRKRFFLAIPYWLRYSSENKVMSDFDKILANKSVVLA